MAAPVINNPNVADRALSTWWTAPIGVGTVNTNVVYLSDLPTSDPAIAGALFIGANGVVTQSDGTP